ncbi:MAG TPA: hypothetical protein VID27_17045 [Blastocatellia bacterium]
MKSKKKAALARKWKAAFLSFFILASVAVLCVVIIQSGAKERPPASVSPLSSGRARTSGGASDSTSPGRAKPRRFLAYSERTAEELVRDFLNALAEGDEKKIASLRITKQEFCQYVWPELPSSRTPNVTCDWVWDQATLKSLSGLSEMLSKHKGKRYQLISLRFAKGTDSYDSYKVHKETRVTVRDEHGVEKELRLFGSMLEMDGQFKLFSFVID